jgi:multiple sugar transport system substrate-binding protein
MKKQLYILTALLVAISMFLAACGTTTPTAAPATAVPVTMPTTAAPATAAPVTVPTTAAATTTSLSIICRCVVGGSNSNEANWILNYVIPNFTTSMKAQGKDVTVSLVQFGGSDEELQARYALDLKGGSGSDLMDFDGFWTPQFASGGLIKPLSDIVGPTSKDWEGWAHISSGLQQLLSYQGQIYGIPTGTDARVIWYRKDLLKQAGLPDNWQPKSWDDLLAAARQIKKALPGVIPLQLDAGTAMGEATTMQGWYMVFLGTGNNVYDYQTNKFPDSGQAFLDALNLYKTIYVDENLGDARTQLLTDGRDQSFLSFAAAKTAMLVEGDWFWRSVIGPGGEAEMKDRDTLVGWAMMPAETPGKGINGQDYVTVSGGTGFIMNPNTKDPANAWALMTFMYSKAARDNFETLQPGISSRDDVAVPNDTTLTAIAKELLPLTTVRPADPAYSEFVSPALQLMTERVVSGEMTPQQALAAFTTEQNADVGAAKVEVAK